MPDGQLKSHTIAVCVTHNIQENQKPQLQLLRSHAVTDKEENEDVKLSPILVAPNQEWSRSENNQQIRRTGTLLLFDIASAEFFPKPMIRVRPVIYWTEGGLLQKVVGKNEVNVGDVLTASLWTVLFTVAAVSFIIFLASRVRKTTGATRASLVQFLSAVDGHLSLGQTQIACWTVVVGSVVLGYGLIRLEIPTIPASLLALMGASLATGGVAYFQDSQNQQAAAAGPSVPSAAAFPPAAPPAAVPAANGEQVENKVVPQLSDLVKNFAAGKAQGQPSLAKAQMIFWTILLLVLFVSKSILAGSIWITNSGRIVINQTANLVDGMKSGATLNEEWNSAAPTQERLARTPMLRKRPASVWSIEPVQDNPEDLFRSALASLGYKDPETVIENREGNVEGFLTESEPKPDKK
jgi:hypothetical protein